MTDREASENQFAIRSSNENLLVTSFLSEEGFSEKNNGPFVRDDQIYSELKDYWESGLFDTEPGVYDLEDALEDLEEAELVDRRTHTESYGDPEFYRLTEEGAEAYEEIKDLSGIAELDFAYST